MVRSYAALAAAGTLCACAAVVPPPHDTRAQEAACRAYFQAFDRAVTDAGVADAEAARVRGFAYLRVDRFLASHRDEVEDARFDAWARALARLDREARAVEIENLPPESRAAMHREVRELGLPDLEAAALDEGCGRALAALDLASAEGRARLRDAAVVPDDYQTWKRVIGLYALTRVPFAAGVRGYEGEVHARFDAPLDALPARTRPVVYAPEGSAPATELAAATARLLAAAGAFEAPDPDDARYVLAAHAPLLDVDEALPEDRIGVVRRDAMNAQFDASRAVVYGRIAFTRFDGRVLAQAVYTAWFPGRPKTSAFDLLGGKWDALVWRATLDEAGRPLVFDTMHACGCYHMFIPTPRVALRPRPDTLDEWALVPQTLPAPAPGERVRLRVASRTHYLERVTLEASAAADRRYVIAPERELRTLRGPDGRSASLYGPDGIVAGSERAERYFFWPMGIAEPGAMRQWGRHATAFVGRRHFDEPGLLDRYFVPR
jgi:hypothetical protein